MISCAAFSDVYLAMPGGQTALHFEVLASAHSGKTSTSPSTGEQYNPTARPPLVVPANENELVAHRDWLRRLGIETLGSES